MPRRLLPLGDGTLGVLCLVKYIVSYASINRLNAPLVVNAQGALPIDLIDMCYSRVLTTPVAWAKGREVGTTVGEERGESMHMQMRQSVS